MILVCESNIITNKIKFACNAQVEITGILVLDEWTKEWNKLENATAKYVGNVLESEQESDYMIPLPIIFEAGTHEIIVNPIIKGAGIWLECDNEINITSIEYEPMFLSGDELEREAEARAQADAIEAQARAQADSERELLANKITSWGDSPTDAQYPSARLVYNDLQREQSIRQDADSQRELLENKITSWGSNPTDVQYPSAKLVHDSLGGGGPHKLDDINIHLAPEDTTDFDATKDHHGLMPKLSDNDGEFLSGKGLWKNPKQFYWLPDLTPPQLSEFEWVNQGSAVADQDNGALYMSDAPSRSGDKLRMLVKPLTSQLFDVRLGFNTLQFNDSYHMVELFLYNSDSGKAVSLSLRNDNIQEYLRWNSPTSWNSAVGINRRGTGTTLPIYWYRIIQNSSNRILYSSVDGYHWLQLLSLANNDFIVPNQIGFGINAYSTLQQQALFVHWSLTYS